MFIKSKSNYCSNIAVLFFLTFFIVFSMGSAKAQIAPDACDDEYYNSMKEKAWMEVQREIESNNHYIWRPDSVLQYTCFYNMVTGIIKDTDLFSYDTNRSSTAFPLDAAFDRAAMGVFNSYISSQEFDTTYLNVGTGSVNIGTAESAGSYTCDLMSNAWSGVKCTDNDNVSFYSLSEIAAGSDAADLRTFTGPAPMQCPTGGAAPDEDAYWQASYTRATDLTNGGSPIPNYFDSILAQFDLWLALDETNPAGGTLSTCADPIPTGVIIRTNTIIDGYADAICPNTGCSMQVSAAREVSCCASDGTTSCSAGRLPAP